MSDLKVCRICLRSGLKFYRLDQYYLKKYYEEVVNTPIGLKDGFPHYFCYECAALLFKFHKFREKCCYGQKVLKKMLSNGQITHIAICENSKKNLHNYGNLDILYINNKVKTVNIKHPNMESEEKNYVKVEDVTIDYYDNSFSDDNYDETGPETDPVAQEQEIDSDNGGYEYTELGEEVDLKPDIFVHEETIKDVSPEPKEKVKRTKKVVTKSKKKKHKYPNEDDSEEEINLVNLKRKLSKGKKKTSIISPNPKTYKFTKSKDGKLRSLAFLDSGYWKKLTLSEEEALKEFQGRAKDKKYWGAAYRCTDCLRGFSQKNMLDRHMPQRHGEAAGSLVCHFCKMRFKSAYFLNKHMRQHFTKYQCLRCNLVCNLENSALFHEEYHKGVIRKCTHCDKEFRHLSTFYTHLRTHRSKHMCALCGESFVSQLGLRLHKKSKHPNEKENLDVAKEQNTYCDLCKIKFETQEAFDKHLQHSAMHTDDFSNKELADCEIVEDDVNDNEDSNITEELVKRKSRVEKTLCAVRKSLPRRPTSKKPTTCYQCGKHFETQSACMKHHIAQHPRTSFFAPAERVICEICGASLAPGSVAAHNNQHTRRKMYTCDSCGRSFTTSTMLRNHMVTHTGEKKFACSLCDKRFTQNGSLSLHYRTFHLKQPYPKRNRRKKSDKPIMEIVPINGKEE